MQKYCVDCGKPFETNDPGCSPIRDAACNKKNAEQFKKPAVLKRPNEFSNEDEALLYYKDLLKKLLSTTNKSLEQLLAEKETAFMPSDLAVIVVKVVDYIDQLQGF